MRRCSQNMEVQFQMKYLWKLQRFLCPVSRVRRGCNSLFLSVFIYLACKFKCHWLNKNPITLYILDELLIICAGLICIALALIFHASKTIVMFHQLIHLQPNSLTQTNDKIWISSQGKQKIFTSCWIPIMNAIHLLNFSLISRTDCCNWLSWFVFTMSVLWLIYAWKKLLWRHISSISCSPTGITIINKNLDVCYRCGYRRWQRSHSKVPSQRRFNIWGQVWIWYQLHG